jgi:hypothetical protein
MHLSTGPCPTQASPATCAAEESRSELCSTQPQSPARKPINPPPPPFYSSTAPHKCCCSKQPHARATTRTCMPRGQKPRQSAPVATLTEPDLSWDAGALLRLGAQLAQHGRLKALAGLLVQGAGACSAQHSAAQQVCQGTAERTAGAHLGCQIWASGHGHSCRQGGGDGKCQHFGLLATSGDWRDGWQRARKKNQCCIQRDGRRSGAGENYGGDWRQPVRREGCRD